MLKPNRQRPGQGQRCGEVKAGVGAAVGMVRVLEMLRQTDRHSHWLYRVVKTDAGPVTTKGVVMFSAGEARG